VGSVALQTRQLEKSARNGVVLEAGSTPPDPTQSSREHHIELLLDGALEAAARLQRDADGWGKVVSQINLQLD
jgi:hypothetical protein